LQLARWLAEDGIDVFNVSAGTYESRQWIYTPAGVEPGSLVPLATAVKEATARPVVGISRLGMDLDLAASFVASGAIDLVGMGRSQLADPHTVLKTEQGRKAEIRPCIASGECAREFIAKQKRMQCAVNPELGNEFRRTLQLSRRPRRVLVVGAGPAGMEAARSAALRGHEVVLLEAASEVGGQLRHCSGPSFHRAEMTALLAWWKNELDRLRVDVRVGVQVKPDDIPRFEADQVLIASGAVWKPPKDLLALFGPCPSSHDVLLDPSAQGESVLVVGGTEAGLNAALALADGGCEVTLVDDGLIGQEISDLIRNEMLRQAKVSGVRLLEHATVTAARQSAGSWAVELAQDREKLRTEVTSVVLSATPHEGVHNWASISGARFIGTIAQPAGRLYQATQDGFWATVDS
jgi:NADPH-dependent 2,4-dienoyl-CoA reductase/sulfur reductase-like enzyme